MEQPRNRTSHLPAQRGYVSGLLILLGIRLARLSKRESLVRWPPLDVKLSYPRRGKLEWEIRNDWSIR